MEKILKELAGQQNVRSNLSCLRQLAKDEEKLRDLKHLISKDSQMLIHFLQSEDAKTRKNAALLLGDLGCQQAADALFDAYQKEETLFVKSAYLTALSHMDAESFLPVLRMRLKELTTQEIRVENRKHVEEEIRALRRILIRCDGITHHTFHAEGKICEVLLTTNRMQRGFIRKMIPVRETKVHPLGVLVRTDHLGVLSQIRTYRELLFPIHTKELLSANPADAARELWESDLFFLLSQLHIEDGAFYFRVECKSTMTLEERSMFSRRLAYELERLSGGRMINSTSDYEIELRLIANKEGKFFPCLKCYTWKDERFAYRKHAIAASIHPSTAALIMELAEPYLKEHARIMDPFCGVGTMLIERDKKIPVKEAFATDIFGDAIVKGRENAALAGKTIHFIHRDFFDFRHDHLFDEIITNMPVRGKKSKEEMDRLYADFFEKALEILAGDAVVVMYTNELGFVKKQLRLHKEFHCMQEIVMQEKNDFYLLIIGLKR